MPSYAERKQPWKDKHGKRIWELEYEHSYRCLNMAEVREYLDKNADHTHQVSYWHETDGSITDMNRSKYWLRFYQQQTEFLTRERDSLNDNIKGCEEWMKIFSEQIEKKEAEGTEDPEKKRHIIHP